MNTQWAAFKEWLLEEVALVSHFNFKNQERNFDCVITNRGPILLFFFLLFSEFQALVKS